MICLLFLFLSFFLFRNDHFRLKIIAIRCRQDYNKKFSFLESNNKELFSSILVISIANKFHRKFIQFEMANISRLFQTSSTFHDRNCPRNSIHLLRSIYKIALPFGKSVCLSARPLDIYRHSKEGKFRYLIKVFGWVVLTNCVRPLTFD